MSKKQPPKPYGKKGGLKHQAATIKQAEEQAATGATVQPEFPVDVPQGGQKKKRFVDLAVFMEEVLALFIQIGKTNADSETPAKREGTQRLIYHLHIPKSPSNL